MNYTRNRTSFISSRIPLLMMFFIILAFCACSRADTTPKMYIEKATLTEEEKDIAFLLGMGDGHHIYDFKVDDTTQSIQVNIYELKNGEWQPISSFGKIFNDTEGRLALSFKNLASGLQVVSLGKNNRSSLKYSSEFKEELESMSKSTSMLTNRTEITYEKEIPLVIQIMTAKSSFTMNDMESFYTPDDYMKLGYEYVHAVTIMFSQKDLDEISINKEYQ